MAHIIHNEKWRRLTRLCNQRWFEFKYVAERERLIQAAHSGVRFIVNHSGRRAYKTETAKRYVVQQAAAASHGMPYFVANPTMPQARGIWWEDLLLLTYAFSHSKKPNITNMEIYPDCGSMIKVIGMNEPARFEGKMWAGGIIDEFDNCKPKMWESNVRPALDSEYPNGYVPWCWLIGVPELGGPLERIVRKSRGNPEWAVFCWKSEEVLSEKKISDAREDLSKRQYEQEYEGKFVQAVGIIYGDYSEANLTTEEIKPHEKLIWTHDQNYTPLCSTIFVKRNGIYFALDEIVLESADAHNTVAEFCERYKNHLNKSVELHGDPYGKHGEKHGKKSQYNIIENKLKQEGWSVENRVRMSHPSISDSQNSLRALICNGDGERRFFVNKDKAPWTNEGLSTVGTKEGSAFQEDDKNEYHHITTAVRYWAFVEHPVKRDTGPDNLTSLGW